MNEPDEHDPHRLLICDDDPQIGRFIARVAQGLGYQVRTVAGVEALEIEFDAWQPVCVVLDLMMPGLDGIEALKRLSTRKTKPRIVLSSGVGERILDSARNTALAYGIPSIAVLPKPFTLEDVRHALAPDTLRKTPDSPTSVHEAASELRADDLKAAIDNHWIQPVYQPKIDCRTQAVVGFEALARWRSPDGRTIMPVDFIPLAMSSGLIGPLTEAMAQTSLRWLSESFPNAPMSLALNTTVQSYATGTLREQLAAYCERWSIPQGRVVLELTEGEGLTGAPEIISELTRVRMLGFQLSIDDFGTGYSSMLELARLPFTELKIDQAFVRNITTSKESQAIVKLSVELAGKLGLSVVAEGVENAPILDYVSGVGCHYAQGYYIARPMEGPQAASWAWERLRR